VIFRNCSRSFSSVIWTVFSAKDFTRILPSCVQQFLIFLFLKRSLVFDSRRTNLKISGIKEQGRGENTDDLVLDVINNLILNHQGVSLNYSHIGRTHRVGPPPSTWVMQLWIFDHVYPYWLLYKNKSLCKQLRYIQFVYVNNIQWAVLTFTIHLIEKPLQL
jgi:hypothetical protein